MPQLQLSKDQNSAFNDITDWYVYHQNSVPFLTMGGYAGTGKTTLMSLLQDKLNKLYKRMTINSHLCRQC